MDSFKPAMVWPLADMLVEEMEARDWTVADVAKNMPGSFVENALIVDLILAISSTETTFKLGDSVAEGLATAFGVSVGFINGLHDVWVNNPGAQQPFTCPEHLLSSGVTYPEVPDHG